MKTQTVNTNITRSFLVAAAAVGMLLFISIAPTFGQKDDSPVQRAKSREGTMETGYLTKADISDDLEGTEDEYFYKFSAGPGKLTLTLEVLAGETNAGAMLDLLGANAKAILSNMLVQAANRGSEMAFQSVDLTKKQDIIIRIKGLKYGNSGGYPGVYKIRLEGTAVNFTQAESTGESGSTDKQTPGTAGNTKADAAPPDGETGDTPPDGTDKSGKQTGAPNKTGSTKKPSKAESVIDKVTTKSQTLLDLIEKIKPKKP